MKMEELKKTNSNLRKKMLEAIVGLSAMLLQVLFIVCGIAYLFAVGSLLVKLFASTIGSIILLGGAFEIVREIKAVKALLTLSKVGNSIEDLFDKNSEENK